MIIKGLRDRGPPIAMVCQEGAVTRRTIKEERSNSQHLALSLYLPGPTIHESRTLNFAKTLGRAQEGRIKISSKDSHQRMSFNKTYSAF